jgi:AcrR family transcriptional regulator
MALGARRASTWQPTQGDASWERLRQAVIDIVLAEGYDGLEVEAALRQAGFDRDEFDRRFEGKDDCCLKVYEANMADFDRLVFGAYEEHDAWRDGLRAAAYAAAGYLRTHPREVVYGEIQMREGSEMAQAIRDAYLQRIVDLIDAGRQELDDPGALGRSVAESVCGSVYGYLVRELQSGAGTRSAEDLVPELMYIAVRPYLGHEAARAELEMPPPHQEARS